MALALSLDGGVELEWMAPQECPTATEIEARVDAMSTVRPTEPLSARGRVRARNGNYELSLDWQVGQRREHERLISHDCDELGRLAALLLASSIDPFAFVRPASRDPTEIEPHEWVESFAVVGHVESADPGELELVSAGDPNEPRALDQPPEPDVWQLQLVAVQPEEPPDRMPPVSGVVLVEGQGFINLLPRPGGGPRLSLGVELQRFRATLGGAGWFAPGFRSTSDPSIGARLSAWSVELDGCGLPSSRRLVVPLCGQLGAGQIIGTGYGVTDARTKAPPWLWLGADASLEWWVRPHFALVLGVGVGFSLLRPGFEIIGSDARFDVPVASGRLRAGVVGRFGDRRRSRRTDR